MGISSSAELRVRSEEEAEEEGESGQRVAPPLQETEKEDDQQRFYFFIFFYIYLTCYIQSLFFLYSFCEMVSPYCLLLFLIRTRFRCSAADFGSFGQTEPPFRVPQSQQDFSQ